MREAIKPRVTTYSPALVVEATSATYFLLKWGVQKGQARRVEFSGTESERTLAISRCIARGTGPEFLATCASGRKNRERTGITSLPPGLPFPTFCRDVFDETASKLPPIFDIEPCIAWGHFASLRGCLDKNSPPTLIFTLGDAVYESLWKNGEALKADELSSPSLDTPISDTVTALLSAVDSRRMIGVERVVLDSTLIERLGIDSTEFERLTGIKTEITTLPEAAAIGALVMTAQERGQQLPRAL